MCVKCDEPWNRAVPYVRRSDGLPGWLVLTPLCHDECGSTPHGGGDSGVQPWWHTGTEFHVVVHGQPRSLFVFEPYYTVSRVTNERMVGVGLHLATGEVVASTSGRTWPARRWPKDTRFGARLYRTGRPNPAWAYCGYYNLALCGEIVLARRQPRKLCDRGRHRVEFDSSPCRRCRDEDFEAALAKRAWERSARDARRRVELCLADPTPERLAWLVNRTTRAGRRRDDVFAVAVAEALKERER